MGRRPVLNLVIIGVGSRPRLWLSACVRWGMAGILCVLCRVREWLMERLNRDMFSVLRNGLVLFVLWRVRVRVWLVGWLIRVLGVLRNGLVCVVCLGCCCCLLALELFVCGWRVGRFWGGWDVCRCIGGCVL